MYSVNIEPHLPGPRGSVTEFAFDVDEHYVAECRERAWCWRPNRCAIRRCRT
jgi:hypothetical protein